MNRANRISNDEEGNRQKAEVSRKKEEVCHRETERRMQEGGKRKKKAVGVARLVRKKAEGSRKKEAGKREEGRTGWVWGLRPSEGRKMFHYSAKSV
jgi:hypothetical protein